MKNPKRTLLIGVIVWLLFFGWWYRGFLLINWRFRLFSFGSWRHLANEFRQGWRISSLGDWIFILSCILSVPCFILLWYLFNKIHWTKLFKKIWRWIKSPFLTKKKKELKKAEAAYAPKKAPAPLYQQRPRPIPSNGSNFSTINVSPQMGFLNNSTAIQNMPTDTSMMPFPETQSSFSDLSPAPAQKNFEPFTNEAFAKMANTPISEVEIPKMEPAVEDIPALLEKNGYTLADPSIISDLPLDFVAFAEEELLLALCDKETGDWLADEESFNDEDPLWFSETDHRVSPVFQLKQLAGKIQEKLGDQIIVHPLLIEKNGTIINAEDMLKTWNDLHVSVARTAEGGPVELPTVSEILHIQEKISLEKLEKIKSLL